MPRESHPVLLPFGAFVSQLPCIYPWVRAVGSAVCAYGTTQGVRVAQFQIRGSGRVCSGVGTTKQRLDVVLVGDSMRRAGTSSTHPQKRRRQGKWLLEIPHRGTQALAQHERWMGKGLWWWWYEIPNAKIQSDRNRRLWADAAHERQLYELPVLRHACSSSKFEGARTRQSQKLRIQMLEFPSPHRDAASAESIQSGALIQKSSLSPSNAETKLTRPSSRTGERGERGARGAVVANVEWEWKGWGGITAAFVRGFDPERHSGALWKIEKTAGGGYEHQHSSLRVNGLSLGCMMAWALKCQGGRKAWVRRWIVRTSRKRGTRGPGTRRAQAALR
ncbi:hypothetical protein C8R45DRAFT_934163 [Mycena sanguinolenta]|nr:hypothetical protein C8R45DRAFT_934163 [Mycena sanguinolenta]